MLGQTITTSRLNALLAALVLAGGAALGAGIGGYILGHGKAKAQGDAALSALALDHAQAYADAQEEAWLRLNDEIQRNQILARQLADEKAAHAKERESLLKRIRNVTTVYVPAPGSAAQPLPRSVFTAGFVREYNAAIGLPTTNTCTVAAGTGDTSATGQAVDTWLCESGLSQADILAHIADYGERCRNLESQVNRLLDREGDVDGHH
ncbi:hypothetical protein ACMSSJ_10820 [Kerstersia gyiorum]|uniref:hypothetical protein n=1 Tax=Pseudomonadota TaxID=1224 RepID=UPI0006D3BD7D|nr:hypothetical protein [Pseudomonas sp. NBRC 111143]